MATPIAKQYSDMVKYTQRELLALFAQLEKEGKPVLESDYHYFYQELLGYWFPQEEGWSIKHQTVVENRIGKPDYLVCVRVNGDNEPQRDPRKALKGRTVVIVEIKRPQDHSTDAAKLSALEQLEEYMDIELQKNDVLVLWGILGIGHSWRGLKMVKKGGKAEYNDKWRDNILSPASWTAMKEFTDTIKATTFPDA